MSKTTTKDIEVRTSHHAPKARGPSTLSLMSSLPTMRSNLPGFMTSLTQHYGDVVRISILNQKGFLLNHPDGVKHVLQSHNQQYSKDVFALQFLKALLGEGLLTNEGASWLQQRRLMQPAFHSKRLHALSTILTDTTTAMLERWQGIAQRAMPFPPLSVPTPRNRRLQATIRVLDTIIEGIISERREQDSDTGDLLSILLQTRDEETGEGMTDKQVRDEAMTLLLAGHETTATALTWTWYLLSQRPPRGRGSSAYRIGRSIGRTDTHCRAPCPFTLHTHDSR